MNVRPVDLLLPRLDGVRESGPGRWYAKCPAHNDRNPSLAVTETNDGRLLIFCMTGCDASQIVAAVGLQLADLFEKPLTHHAAPVPSRSRFNPWDLLRLLRREADVLVIAASMLARGEVLDEVDRERLRHANERIGRAVEVIRGRV